MIIGRPPSLMVTCVNTKTMVERGSKVFSVGLASDFSERGATARKRSWYSRNTSSTPKKNKVDLKTERKGFSVQARRFDPEEYQNGNPGPGAYMRHVPADVISPSFSKRGAGGLASQAARIPPLHRRCIPAPNAYNLQSSLLLKHDFSQVGSCAFQPPIAVTTLNNRNATPAPNQYQVSFSGIDRKTAITAKSVFMSKTGRINPYSNISEVPSPCEYRVSDSLTRPHPSVPFSCFKSSSARTISMVRGQVPGPGTYSPHEPSKTPWKATLPRGHYLCLSAPAVPPPKDPPFPGPGQYNVASEEAQPMQATPRAVFLSGRGRWETASFGEGFPGPGYYNPAKPLKQSFLCNQYKKWVPI